MPLNFTSQLQWKKRKVDLKFSELWKELCGIEGVKYWQNYISSLWDLSLSNESSSIPTTKPHPSQRIVLYDRNRSECANCMKPKQNFKDFWGMKIFKS